MSFHRALTPILDFHPSMTSPRLLLLALLEKFMEERYALKYGIWVAFKGLSGLVYGELHRVIEWVIQELVVKVPQIIQV